MRRLNYNPGGRSLLESDSKVSSGLACAGFGVFFGGMPDGSTGSDVHFLTDLGLAQAAFNTGEGFRQLRYVTLKCGGEFHS